MIPKSVSSKSDYPHLTARAYDTCVCEAKVQYKENQNRYLIDTIEAIYARFEDPLLFGNVRLNLNKVVEMINCFAAKTSSLHKVKLMKLLWYADSLHFKRTGRATSGLVYLALDMGAVPEAHRHLMLLDGIAVDEVEYGEHIGYRLRPVDGFAVKQLNSTELAVLDDVIDEFGALNAQHISARMHEEEAYQRTPLGRPISFELARNLSIDLEHGPLLERERAHTVEKGCFHAAEKHPFFLRWADGEQQGPQCPSFQIHRSKLKPNPGSTP